MRIHTLGVWLEIWSNKSEISYETYVRKISSKSLYSIQTKKCFLGPKEEIFLSKQETNEHYFDCNVCSVKQTEC